MTVKELSTAPGLTAQYAKAVLGGLRKSRRDTLPDLEYVRTNVIVDPRHLAAYNRVCGFRLTDELPATYPHILAFPLQIALMTEPGFPFPLLGMVHIANRITQRRPVRIGEELTLRVRTQNLRPHEKGTQFDVVSEVHTADTEDAVWIDTSTYLRRGGNPESASGRSEVASRLAPPAPEAVWQVPADTGRRYAEVSGDRNPIHLYRLTARMFGFRSAIAHGMWTKARSLAAFEGGLPKAYTVDVQFKRPVLLPAKIAFTSWQTGDAAPDGQQHDEQRSNELYSAGARPGWAFELWSARHAALHLRGALTAE